MSRARIASVTAGLFLLLPLVGSGNSREGEAAGLASVSDEEIRRLAVDYSVEIAARTAGRQSLHVFLPIAVGTAGQKILNVEVVSDLVGQFDVEPVYGNRYWHAEVPADMSRAIPLRVSYEVERRVLRAGDETGDEEAARRFLSANERVVVGHPILEPILAEIATRTPAGASDADRARAIYDWIVDNVEYKKIGSGWGNGDTFWACNERYGNCTDFHSLFISLARTVGIPARFEMGFPIPGDRSEGTILGYHCWVEFWLPERGWFPIDASEAFKQPEKRELFYGTHPADRIQFTTGRDLKLGRNHRGRPLNYFIYPYVEVDGRRSDIEIKTELRYRELPSGRKS